MTNVYCVLDAQQILVLGETYPEIVGSVGRYWSPDRLLERKHCCPSCSCVYIANPQRKEFEAAVKAAKESGRFHSLEVYWSRDSQLIALIGLEACKSFLHPFRKVLVDQWHLTGTKAEIPSYNETLRGLREEYLSPWCWAARGILLGLMALGVYLVVSSLPHLWARTDPNGGHVFVGGLCVIFSLMVAYRSIKRYRALFQRDAPIPL
ncbi:MAG TPA: hypothetical protein VMA75_03890 [Candidatus Paceibacterota bacterium]|nr:hypothetical protein [Candidatus Paceibacterota bacterium]